MGLQVIFIYTSILFKLSKDVMTFQILEKFKNTLIKNKVEESVYQISRLIKKLELSTVCSCRRADTWEPRISTENPETDQHKYTQLLYDKWRRKRQLATYSCLENPMDLEARQHSLVNKWC